MAMKQEVNAPLIFTVGIVAALLLLVFIIGTQAWFLAAERDEIARKWEQAGNPWLDNLRREQTRNSQQNAAYDRPRPTWLRHELSSACIAHGRDCFEGKSQVGGRLKALLRILFETTADDP